MIDLWWAEAHNHGVLPLDDRGAAALFRAVQRPGLPTTRSRFVDHPPVSHVIADNCPPTARGWTTGIELDHPSSGGDGTLVVGDITRPGGPCCAGSSRGVPSAPRPVPGIRS